MKRLFLITLVVFFSAGVQGDIIEVPHVVNAGMLIGSGAGGGGAAKTYIFQDFFEDTDGVYLYSHTEDYPGNGYVGDNESAMQIDNAQFYAGSTSYWINSTRLEGNTVCSLFDAEVTSGKFTVDFYMRNGACASGDENNIFGVYDGADSWSDTNMYLYLKIAESTEVLKYYTDTSTSANGTATTLDEWKRVEIEIDVTNDTFNSWYDGVQDKTNQALGNTTLSPDRVCFAPWSNMAGGTESDQWLDSLEVYSGARQ